MGNLYDHYYIMLTKYIAYYLISLSDVIRDSHRLEKYLNLEGFLEKSLKIKSALKSTGKSIKGLEKSLNSYISVELNTVNRDLNQYKIVVPRASTFTRVNGSVSCLCNKRLQK